MIRLTIVGQIICLLLLAIVSGTTLSYGQKKISFRGRNAAEIIPFALSNDGVILLKARINDFTDTLTLILDTGHPSFAIDSSISKTMGIISAIAPTQIKGIGGLRNFDYTTGVTLSINNIKITGVNCHVSDYSSLSVMYGIRIDGIVGNSFFENHVVVINYDLQKIFLYPQGKYKYPKRSSLIKPVFLGKLPLQTAQAKDSSEMLSNYFFDTGAGLEVMMSSTAAKEKGFLFSAKKMVPTTVAGLGGKVSLNLTTIKEIQFAGYKFKNVPLHVLEDSSSSGLFEYPSLNGIIGNELLRRFNIILNYGEKELCLKPNNGFTRLFDYSYTGLEMNYVEGETIVGEIFPNTPAFKAGLKEGDSIIAIDGDFSRNLQTYNMYLLETAKTFEILVSRNNALTKLKLKVESIK